VTTSALPAAASAAAPADALTLSDFPEVLTPLQVGSLFGKTEQQMAHERYKGLGPPFVKYGNKVFYLRSDVIEFLTANRRTRTGDR